MMAILWGPMFVILAISLVRRLFLRKMTMRHRYSLWLPAVVLLLLFPVAWLLPETSLSILNVAEVAKGRLLVEYPQAAPLLNHLETGQVYVDKSSEFLLVRAAGVDWQLILFCVWMLGAILLTVWVWLVNKRLQTEILAKRVLLEKKSSLQVKEPWLTIPIYLVKDLASPCLLQIKGQAAIYIPDRLLENPDSFRHAVAHEMGHFRQGDLRWNVWRCQLLTLYWFHPFVWLGAWLSRQDCELSCDEAAIELLGEKERFAYGRTLLSLVGTAQGARDLVYAGTWMTAGARSLKSRIQQIAFKSHMSLWSVLGFYFSISLIVLLSFGRPKEQTRYPSAEEIVEEMGRKLAERDKIILKVQDVQQEESAESMAEKMAVYLVEHHLQYVGDHVGSGRIVGTCIGAVGVEAGGSMELQTTEEPYVYRRIYRTEEAGALPIEEIRAVSILIFASIDNLGVLELYTGADGIVKEELVLKITRQEAMELYGLEDLSVYGGSVKEMQKLVEMVQEKL